MAADGATNPSISSSIDGVAPEHYVPAGVDTLLNAQAAAIWEQALAKARGLLANLISDPNREALFADVFGHAGSDPASFAANLQNLIANLGGEGLRIAVYLRSDGELAGAFAAYAASGHTGSERIYVNADKLNNGLLDVTLATSMLLEEFGHALDWRLNGGADSPGDEGQLFAAEVSGVVLTAEQRALIDAEDDTATLTIEGVEVLVELATFTATTGTDNPALSTDNDTVTVTDTTQIQAADTFSGGAGTDTIAIGVVGAGVSVDLSAAASDGSAGFLSFEAIQFLNTSGTSTATFAAEQFGSGKIELTSSFTGTDSTQGVVINLAAAGSIDASLFIINSWSNAADSFTFAGSIGNDTIVGTGAADSISGASGNDNLFGSNGPDTINGGDGDDTIDGAKGNDILTGGAGVDFFITSAIAGSSTVATGNTLASTITSGNTLTFANGVDIITDFAVGTDILRNRNTQSLLTLIGRARGTDLTTNRGYYGYGAWNGTIFTLTSAWSTSDNDLIFVVGDIGNLTPQNSTGYTILTDISGSIDTIAPTITSFSTTTANGSYKAGDSINITATASEAILAGGQITVTLNASTNPTVILTAATTGSTLTGTYAIAAGQTSPDLTVSSFTIGTGAIGTSNATPRDAAFGNALTSGAVPPGVNNIAGSYAIVVDTTAPAALTLTAPADSGSSSSDGITKNSGFSISTPEANATWEYSTNGGSNWTTGSATSFTVADGTYNSGVIQVRQIDQAGNPGPITSSTASITIDTVAPTIAISDNNSGTAKIGQDVTFTFNFSEDVTGFSADAITVANATKGTFTAVSSTVYTLGVTPTASGSGNVTIDVDASAVTDAAGNGNTAPAQYTQAYDTAAPNAPVISTITDDVGTITGTIASGGSTNDTVLVLAGTSEANSSVTVYDGSTSLGTTSADGSGVWTFTTATLTDGSTYSFNATVTDAAGNVSSASANYTVTVDTVISAGSLSLANYTDSGTSSSDFISTDNSFDLSLGSQEDGATVVYQVSTDGGSNWSTTTTAQSNLSDGAYQFRAVVSDAAGNTANTNSISLTVDTAAPNAGTLSLANYTDSGTTNTDFISTSNSFDLSLSEQEDGATVDYQVSTDCGSNWSTTTTAQSNLSDGAYQFRAVVSDAAGNTANTNSISLTVDTAAPNAGTLSLINYTDSGTTNTDFISTSNSFDLALSGQEDGASVDYQVSTDGGSNWSTTSTGQSNLGDGAYQFRAVVSDAAGNTANTETISITVDTAALNAPAFSLATDSGASNSDGVTNAGTVSVSGVEDNATWEYSTDSGSNWTTGSDSSFALEEGSYAIGAIRVRQTDLAGNTTVTPSQNDAVITVDLTAPTSTAAVIAITDNVGIFQGPVASGATTDDSSLSISGSLSFALAAGDTVRIYDGSEFLGNATVSEDGTTWNYADSRTLSDNQSVSYTARVADAAGNQSAAGTAYTATVDTAITAGTLSLTNYTYSGSSNSDFISSDNSFDLSLSGQESGATVVYQLSTDGGNSWSITTSAQRDLNDGAYQFRAVLSDAAGNTDNTNTISLTQVSQISVTAIANGNEANGNPAVFRFSRNGSTTDSLSVSYRLLGTAQAGSDYSGATSGTISFAAGSSSAELSLPALADSVIDPGETIIAEIVPSPTATPSYLITPGQQTAIATITAEGMVVSVKGPSRPLSSNGEIRHGSAFAVLKADGSVVTWGGGGNGGDSNAVASQLSSGVSQIFSTEYAFAALKADGSVVTWGSGEYGGNSSAVASQLSSGVIKIFSNKYAFAALKETLIKPPISGDTCLIFANETSLSHF